MNIVSYAWLLFGLIGIIDAFRHSASDWAYADRRRGFWVAMMFFFGPLFAPIYALAVRPRFPKADSVSSAFLKD